MGTRRFQANVSLPNRRRKLADSNGFSAEHRDEKGIGGKDAEGDVDEIY